jgi:hypothetical protein
VPCFSHIKSRHMKSNRMVQKRGLLLLGLSLSCCMNAGASVITEGDSLDKRPAKRITESPLPDSVVASEVPPQWQLECTTQYMDQVVFSGRDYGIKQFAVIPKIALIHRSGFWVGATGYYLSSVSSLNKQPISKRDLAVGFQTNVTNWWGTSFAYSDWKYFGKSRSELRYTFDYLVSNYNAVNCGWFTLTPQAYAMAGHQNRSKVFQMGLGVTRYFEKRFPKDVHGVWSFSPEWTMMTSTSASDGLSEPPTWFHGKTIKIVSHELILPLTYQANLHSGNKKLGQLVITPRLHFVMAMNAEKHDGARLHPFSYWTADFKYVY